MKVNAFCRPGVVHTGSPEESSESSRVAVDLVSHVPPPTQARGAEGESGVDGGSGAWPNRTKRKTRNGAGANFWTASAGGRQSGVPGVVMAAGLFLGRSKGPDRPP